MVVLLLSTKRGLLGQFQKQDHGGEELVNELEIFYFKVDGTEKRIADMPKKGKPGAKG